MRPRARRWKPTRCISAPICGRRSRVLIGLAGVALGFKWADAAAALVVAVVVLIAGWRLGRRTIDTLIDTAPPGIADQVTRIARRVPGVVAIDSVRARQVGPDQFVELNISVSRTMPIDRVAAMKEAVINAVCAELPKAKISVVTEPRALDNETVMDRVMVIARNRGLAVHHVTVHAIGGKLSVSLDLEVEGSLTLAAAHDIADGLEMRDHRRARRRGRGRNPYRAAAIRCLRPRRERPRVSRRFKARCRRSQPKSGLCATSTTSGCAKPTEGEIINFHCRVDPSKTVHDVHEKVDELERALRRKWPSIKRVIGHAEPLPAQQR